MRMHRPTPFVGAPRVSVVIPCYRYGVYLPAAVASALDQADLDVDVLIVDDASPDDSAKVAEELASADPRVDVLVHGRTPVTSAPTTTAWPRRPATTWSCSRPTTCSRATR
jgi:cellulose synthase/poly-beta-1,6-N-acetylglucosamine synthase-like glycosyltransferase